MSFFEELKRRNVFRVGVAYVVASWVILQVADLVFEAIKAPDWVLQAMMSVVVLGFFASLIIAWAYEVTSPRQEIRNTRIGDMRDDEGNPIQFARPGTCVYPDLGVETKPNDLIRKLNQPRT